MNVVPLKRPQRLQCSSCGASAEASCDCGVAYVPAGKRAEAAVAANPEKSDRAIAAEIGVSHPTVAAARKRSTGKDLPVDEKRTGMDGKQRRVPEPKQSKAKKVVPPRRAPARRESSSCDFDWDNVKPEDFGDADTAYKRQAIFFNSESLRHAQTHPLLRVTPNKVTRKEIRAVRNVAEAWSDLADKISRQPKPSAAPSKTAGPDMATIKQAGEFHIELMKYTEDFCERIKTWHAAGEIDDESHNCVVQALETASIRLQRVAQDIDGR